MADPLLHLLYRGALYEVFWVEWGIGLQAMEAFRAMQGRGKGQLLEAIIHFANRGVIYPGRGHAQGLFLKISEHKTGYRFFAWIDEATTPKRLVVLSHFISDHKNNQERREMARAQKALDAYAASKVKALIIKGG